ncbi:hypothetical protein EI94DRAFT_1738861 [Lactarius quietus]|nr:hypothetical protein EI94DRAFT_1738861 [Lactarius quietus]
MYQINPVSGGALHPSFVPFHCLPWPNPTRSGELRYFLILYIYSYRPCPHFRLDTKVTSLISKAATLAAVIVGLHLHQFVRFACHGTLESGKPFKAGYELYGNERLTLLEIVHSHLPTTEFLSACHTAEVTEGSIMDERLHLAAAVQYCGFHCVVRLCGRWWTRTGGTWQDIFTRLCSLLRGERYRIMKELRKLSGSR